MFTLALRTEQGAAPVDENIVLVHYLDVSAMTSGEALLRLGPSLPAVPSPAPPPPPPPPLPRAQSNTSPMHDDLSYLFDEDVFSGGGGVHHAELSEFPVPIIAPTLSLGLSSAPVPFTVVEYAPHSCSTAGGSTLLLCVAPSGPTAFHYDLMMTWCCFGDARAPGQWIAPNVVRCVGECPSPCWRTVCSDF